MIWVIVAAGVVALAGAIALALHAVSLSHKARDVRAEVARLNGRVVQLRTLVGQLDRTPGRHD